MTSSAPENAGLYVHVPFCTSVCPYCDFAVTIAGEERREGWVEGVISEAEMYEEIGLTFDTLYFGGGTPSSLSPEQLSRVVDALDWHLDLVRGVEIFLEANPEDVNARSAAAWRRLGVDFVSLGVQSFDDTDLGVLGRRHSAQDAFRAVDELMGAGFSTVSIDLMYGLHGRSPEHWRAQLETAVGLGTDHLSCYQLTIHPKTLLGRRVARGTVKQLEDVRLERLFFLTHEVLTEAGFEGYEVSNFASSPEHRSKHNQKYWDHSPYLGLGPSAHSFAAGRRWWNRPRLRLWQKALATREAPVEDDERPSEEQLVLETLMLGFRTSEGVDLDRLADRYAVDLMAANTEVVDRLSDSGHLLVDGARLRPTLRGLAIADTLARSFVL
ncbi:MAG: radical SAM family heme chaperone HemW [Acidobacteria bacterium]|nr:radical SAM family heme chaperone HemW [Acidobacteriota bacterium]